MDEFPLHPVSLDAFLIGRYPVTAAEWALFLNSCRADAHDWFDPTPETSVVYSRSRFYPRHGCSLMPANGLSWFGAMAYCRWLSEKTGRRFRLPTEAEWEKAARGGLESKRFPWGNHAARGRAHFGQRCSDPLHTLSPVGAYPPNAFGLHDMAGNVWEWCSDWYDRQYYHFSPHRNPAGPERGAMRVLRGGSWGGLDVQIRCGIRVGEFPDAVDSRVGFRLARNP